MSDPIVPPNASLPAMLAARARGASDGRLLADVLGGVAVASAVAVWRPAAWLILFAASACFASFGLWGIADRELRERATPSNRRLVRALEGVRALSALAGTIAVLTGLFAALAVTLGTWIS